jgi:hypothetical protein
LCFPNTPALHEWDEIKIVYADGETGGDMVANGFEPLALFIGEAAAIRFLLPHPLSETLIHLVTERP